MQAAATTLLAKPGQNLRHCSSSSTQVPVARSSPLAPVGSLPAPVTDDRSLYSLSTTLHPPILEHVSLSPNGGGHPSDGFATPRGMTVPSDGTTRRGMTIHESIHGAANYLKAVSRHAMLWGASSAPVDADNNGEAPRDSGSSTPLADRSLAAAQRASAAASGSGVPSWLMRRCSSAGRDFARRRSSDSKDLATRSKGDGTVVVDVESGPLKTAGELELEAPQCAVSWVNGCHHKIGTMLW